MPAAIRYHRYSSRKQDKGSSIERQHERTEELCRAQGWSVQETLEDKGLSAWKGDHLRVGQLGRLKTRIDAGLVERGTYLVVENLDRLSRQDVKTARRWIEDVTDAGIIVAVCQPPMLIDEEALSGANIVGILMYLLEANRSTGESKRKSDFVPKAKAEARTAMLQGLAATPRVPAWLIAEKGQRPRVIEERAAVVRQIYEWSALGMGPHGICQRLNASVPVWTKGRKHASSWKVGYIRDILSSPAVEGEYHPREDRKPTGEVITTLYPRVVPAELVERGRAGVIRRKATGSPKFSEARNLFAGRAVCGHCGGRMTRTQQGTSDRRYEYLVCPRYKEGAGCENSVQYRYDVLERAAIREILHLALDDTFFIRADDVAPLAGRVADLRKTVDSREAEQRRLLAFLVRSPDATEAEDMLDELRPQLANAREELEHASDELARARGSASPEEHIRRVVEVRDTIYSDNEEERTEARLRVREAFAAVHARVSCSRRYEEGRRRPIRHVDLHIASGLMGWRFDDEGQVSQRFDLRERNDLVGGLTTGELADNAKVVGEVQQRSKAS